MLPYMRRHASRFDPAHLAGMDHFIEAQHDRDRSGRFTTMTRPEPTGMVGSLVDQRTGLDHDALRAPSTYDLDAYEARRDGIWDAYSTAVKATEMSPARYREAAFKNLFNGHADMAFAHAAVAPLDEVPPYRETPINGASGTVLGHARAAVNARMRAFPPLRHSFAVTEAAEDSLASRAWDVRQFTSSDGTLMRARIVRRGETWGENNEHVATEDQVMFFDTERENAPVIGVSEDFETAERHGTLVFAMPVSHLRENETTIVTEGLEPWVDDDGYRVEVDQARELQSWLIRRTA